MSSFIFPDHYQSALNLHDTQLAIKQLKDYFQKQLAQELNLLRVSAPLFVDAASGLNDNLNGVERPVCFDMKDNPGVTGEVVQSLAKWKRYALQEYGFKAGSGLYTDMSAIRRDEITDNIHSVYVDQWDWEKIIGQDQRNRATLHKTVQEIYAVLYRTERYMAGLYAYIRPVLPEQIHFITSEELLCLYPDDDAKEREYKIVRQYGAVFIEQIGGKLSDGSKHDGRSPDYDDWRLNGDILVYYPLLDIALELSSMGIRVDAERLHQQLMESGNLEREKLPFQKMILQNELPYTIGGGIGQSRICMFFLRKAHIGEIQCSIWPQGVRELCHDHGVILL